MSERRRKASALVRIARLYRKGSRVRLVEPGEDHLGDVVHLVRESNVVLTTQVRTWCGIGRFVTYARPSRKAATCLGCIAQEGDAPA